MHCGSRKWDYIFSLTVQFSQEISLSAANKINNVKREGQNSLPRLYWAM
jgi:hypothetical protein